MTRDWAGDVARRTPGDLAGKLLVASPSLGDPHFRRTVVLVLEHDSTGTLGVVLNRPSEVSLGDILPSWAEKASTPTVVFRGGPVGLDGALGLAWVRAHDEPLGWQPVNQRLGLLDLAVPAEVVTPAVDALRVFAGHSGWSSGQLQSEIDGGSWYVLDTVIDDPFCSEPDRLWRAVFRRQQGSVAFVANYPEDPSRN
jgi:putative transcriptional regulator